METESFEFNLDEYRNNAVWPQLLADNVAEELILYFIMEESRFLMELVLPRIPEEEEYDNLIWDTWPFDLFDDKNLITSLYSDMFYLTPEDIYHFNRWWEEQFYSNR